MHRTVDEVIIRCRQKEGAVLVVTSPAEQHEIKVHAPLREYLCENASRLLDFLVEHHDLPHGSSIYVVTGTIHSAAWAMATHGTAMDPSFDTLTLKRIPGTAEREPFYHWRHRGNAQTRTQGRRPSEKNDQCIFLKGFLVTASIAIWNTRRELTLKSTSNPSEGPSNQPNQDGKASSSGSKEGDLKGKGRETSQSGHPLSGGLAHSVPGLNRAMVRSIPSQATSADGYPSREINEALLENVSSSLAPGMQTMRSHHVV